MDIQYSFYTISVYCWRGFDICFNAYVQFRKKADYKQCFDDRNFYWTVCGVYYRFDDCTFRSVMMGTVIMKRGIIQNAQSINEEVFIIGIFVVLLASLIVFPISNIASVFAVGETQQLRQSEKLLPDTPIQRS